MSKTRSELHSELENLENRRRQILADKKTANADYKDQLHDVDDQISQVLSELKDATK